MRTRSEPPSDPNKIWLGEVQPFGIVVTAASLDTHKLVPTQQTKADSEAVRALLSDDADDGAALSELWRFLSGVLGWRETQVAGSPGGPDVPDALRVALPASETVLEPHLAVAAPDGSGWQLLVRSEAAGIEPDKRGVLAGWEATPHQRFERLLRETAVGAGLLVTDNAIRLVYAPSGGETSGWLDIPIRPLATVAGRAMLGGLKLLLDRHRLFGDAPNRRLPALLEASRRSQAEVSSRLAEQVLGALHELLRGLHAAAPADISAIARAQHGLLYEGLLAVLLRLVFLLYAEDRGLIPSLDDPAARAFYDQGYGVRTLHARLLEDEGRHRDTMDERRGAWHRLLVLFRLVHRGDATGWMRGRGGKLFDPGTFPFLQGQSAPGDPIVVPRLSDGCVFRVLDSLLTLDGERLSYRALDVEQIGSVYETVMGFRAEAASGPSLAIRAGKRDRTPVFVNLAALAAEPPKERLKWIKEHTERGKFPAKVEKGILAANNADGLAAALLDVVDERGSPHGRIWPAGTPLLQPTAERRRTGSHYTPRDLTSPIVRHALEPAFERIGITAMPASVLSLKVCDPAMGSGAFLVEACRQLATRLTEAWRVHPGERPPLPPDEDEDLHARRLVAQRCLYGVDRNPMAADLARLSLWLATLARDHEFTFLDHALKSGDSLVGLSLAQISGLKWQDGQKDVAPFSGFIQDRIREVGEGRRAIREAPDDVPRAVQEQRHRDVEEKAREVRLLGDAVLASFFGAAKPKAREDARKALGVAASLLDEQRWPKLITIAARLAVRDHKVRPFHWELEFPEVFSGDNRGFDAVVGNPPFLGGSRISSELGAEYLDYLLSAFRTAGDKTDLVLYFFAKSFQVLRNGGAAGLVATNTISQGDSRSTLRILRDLGFQIYRAVRRLPWPGEATVVVSILHLAKDRVERPRYIDGARVNQISVYLKDNDTNDDPQSLAANDGRAFEGFGPYGSGFILIEGSEALSELQSDPKYKDIIFDYVGGEDVLNDPVGKSTRKIIYTEKMDRTTLEKSYPLAFKIIEATVKPERAKKSKRVASMPWWQFLWPRPELRRQMKMLTSVFVRPRVAKHHAFLQLPANLIISNSANIVCSESMGMFALLQSRIHELWARSFSSSMKDDLRYTPSDCFRTFPFPPDAETNQGLEDAGSAYHAYRARLMLERSEGMTKAYNRFHDATQHAPDIDRLRELHRNLDLAALRSYGWEDLADGAAPEYLTEETESEHRYQGRFFWPAPFREEVLSRLLQLNVERAADERRLGLTPVSVLADGDAELEDAD